MKQISNRSLGYLTALLVLICVVFSFSLAGCSPSTPPPSHSTLEDTRSTSLDNALFNAKQYRAQNPRFDEGYKIVPHADEAISPDCPQGSGWASLSVMKVQDKNVEKITVLCSTHSASLGCYRDTDFEKKPFAAEPGKCQPTTKVPFPLPKIAK